MRITALFIILTLTASLAFAAAKTAPGKTKTDEKKTATALCGGLSAELVSDNASARQNAFGRAAALSYEDKAALYDCLAIELNPKLQPSSVTRIMAVDALSKTGGASAQVNRLMELFFSAKTAEEAAAAAAASAPYPSEMSEYAERLGKDFASNSDTGKRLMSAWLLTKMGTRARKAEKQVRPLLKNSDPHIRGWAATTLAFMFPESPDKTSVREIVGFFRYDERTARAALEQLDPEGKKTVALLRPVLQDSNTELRAACALTLGEMKEKAADAVPDIMKLLKSSDSKTSYAAAQALGSIGQAALEPLMDCINTDMSDNARRCSSALAWMGQPAIDRLEHALTARTRGARLNSSAALAMMAGQLIMPQAKMFYDNPQAAFDRLRRTLPALQISADNDTDSDVRDSSLHAITEIQKGLSHANTETPQ